MFLVCQGAYSTSMMAGTVFHRTCVNEDENSVTGRLNGPWEMDHALIVAWLTKWVRKQVMLNWLGGFAVLFAGVALLAATWGLCYVISLCAMGPWLGYPHWVHPIIGCVVIPVLFWGNARTPREYLSEYDVTRTTVSDTIISSQIPRAPTVSAVNPFAPNTMHTGVKMLTDCLYVGPRVVLAAFDMFTKAIRLRHMDLEGCGAVLCVLAKARHKTSFQEIADWIEGLNPVIVFPQVQEIEGVVLLQSDPAGLSLTQELREELLGIGGVRP